jgi:multidrug transporter EmrE-like cation transporter
VEAVKEVMMYPALVVLAAFAYSIGGYYMKLSEGFRNLSPTLGVFALFGLGAGLHILAMRHAQMTTTYIVVLGLEAVVAFVLGVFFLKETSSVLKVAGTALILAGIVLLRFSDA